MSELERVIEKVYIEPIKSILFIDDCFPTYSSLIGSPVLTENLPPQESTQQSNSQEDTSSSSPLAAQDEETLIDGIVDEEDFLDSHSQQMLADQQIIKENSDLAQDQTDNTTTPIETDRAQSLTSSCRKKGLIFDVENNPRTITEAEGPNNFINKPDLIILDYILNAHAGSFDESLQIISLLNSTPRLNLVVVYTSLEPSAVGIQIALSMRGHKNGPMSSGARRRTNFITTNLESIDLLDFLNNDGAAIIDTFPSTKQDGNLLKDSINCVNNFIHETYPSIDIDEDCLISCGHGDNNTSWIHGKNVFIVVAQKKPQEIETIDILMDILKDALCKHAPAPISMLTRYCANILKNDCEPILQHSFGDEKTRAALLYHVLSKDYQCEDNLLHNSKLTYLIERSLNAISYGLQRQIGSIANEFIKSITSETPCSDKNALLKLSCLRENASKDTPLGDIILHINAFLCSEPLTFNFFTTGIVFRNKDKRKYIWICASPACDLVPDRLSKTDRYRADLHPINYFEAIRIHPLKPSDVNIAMTNATQGRYIFLNIDSKIEVFCTESDASTPSPYIFYTTNNGLFNAGNKSTLMTVKKSQQAPETSEAPPLKLDICQVEIIGQLRYEYASRLLHKKGVHNSRIGVDFVNL